MPNFKYKARDKFAKSVSGSTVAPTQPEAVKKLQDMGYTVISIAQVADFDAGEILGRFSKSVRLEEVSIFTRQLYALQKAGLTLLTSLEAIAMQVENRYFRTVIEEVARDIRGGLNFSDALKKQGHIFDGVYVNMIRAAESGGLMSEILERLTGLIEQQIDTRSRIKAATRYPIIAFCVLCLGFLIVVTFVIPRFATLYSQFNVALPLPTRILIATNIAMKKYWYLFILGLGVAIFGFLRFINSRAGRPVWDNFRLKVPVFGPLVSMLTMSRFARVTAILMKSGVPILEILDLVGNTTGNVIIKRAITNIRQSVNQGQGMSEPMKITGLFPPVVIQMVYAGEQTGKVDDLLLSVADYYDRESEYMIKNLTTYIEPLLIFFLALGVLLMALAIFLPMWNLIKVFRPG